MKTLLVGLVFCSTLAMANGTQVQAGKYQDGNVVVDVSVKKTLTGKSQLILDYGDSNIVKFPLTTNDCVVQRKSINTALLFVYSDGIKTKACLNKNSNGKLVGTHGFSTYSKVLGVKVQLGDIEEYKSETTYEMSISHDEINIENKDAYFLRNLHLRKI